MRVRKIYADAIAACDLLPNQHAILAVLAEDGPTYQKLLASRTTVDSGDLVAYLDALQAGTYITRERDPQDRRRHLVTITAAGRRKLAAVERRITAAEDQIFGDLPAEERRTFVNTLVTVYDHADGASSPTGRTQ